MTLSRVVLAAAVLAAWTIVPGPAGAQARKAAKQRPDSIRLTLSSTGQRFVVADDDEQSGCNAAHVAKDGTERMSGWAFPPLAGAGVGDVLVRETDMPICSYKAKGGSSEMCQMRLTGRMLVQLTFEERDDADHGQHLYVWWKPVADSTPPSARVDVGTCLQTRNEQRDGDLTGPMADEFRAAYLGARSDGTMTNSGPIYFPLTKRGWVKAPVSLKSEKNEFTLEVSRR
jgi:hypothetical protein